MSSTNKLDSIWESPKLCPLKHGSKKERACDYESCGFWWKGAIKIDEMCAFVTIAEGLTNIAWHFAPRKERAMLDREVEKQNRKPKRTKC